MERRSQLHTRVAEVLQLNVKIKRAHRATARLRSRLEIFEVQLDASLYCVDVCFTILIESNLPYPNLHNDIVSVDFAAKYPFVRVLVKFFTVG